MIEWISAALGGFASGLVFSAFRYWREQKTRQIGLDGLYPVIFESLLKCPNDWASGGSSSSSIVLTNKRLGLAIKAKHAGEWHLLEPYNAPMSMKYTKRLQVIWRQRCNIIVNGIFLNPHLQEKTDDSGPQKT